MKKIIFTSILSFLLLGSNTISINNNVTYGDKLMATEKEKLNIVFVAGQSNAQGTSPVGEISLPSFDDVMLYQDGGMDASVTKKWINVTPGIGLNSNSFGPEIGMSEILSSKYKNSDEKIAIIRYSWGGTSLYNKWNSPTSVASGLGGTLYVKDEYTFNGRKSAELYYKMMVTFSDAIESLEDQYDLNYLGMCWMQGEGDAYNIQIASSYGTLLTNFINDVRDDLSLPDLPFIIGEIATTCGGRDDIIREQEALVANTVSNTTLIHNRDLPVGYFDAWHFRATSMVKLGNRFGARMIESTDEEIISVDPITINVGLNNKLVTPLYTDVVTTSNVKMPLEVFNDEDETFTELGSFTRHGYVVYKGLHHDVEINVNVINGSNIDGKEDSFYQDVDMKDVNLYSNLETLEAPKYASAKGHFKAKLGDEGLYVYARLDDTQINNKLFKTNVFDLNMDQNNGIELYIDNSNRNVNSLTKNSLIIRLTSGGNLRVYEGTSNGFIKNYSVNMNAYKMQKDGIKDIKYFVSVDGAANLLTDGNDNCSYFEILVPYSALHNVKNINSYRLAVRFTARHESGTLIDYPCGVTTTKEQKDFSFIDISTWPKL
ncbi:MAG: sialate O-acetylesterase [Bacilli bacterium]